MLDKKSYNKYMNMYKSKLNKMAKTEKIISQNIIFKQKVDKIINYYHNYGKLPSAYNKCNKYKVLGQFLCAQKQRYKKNILSNDKYKLLITIPTFKKRLSANNTIKKISFEQKINLVIDYYVKNLILPSSNSSDTNVRKLG